MTMPAARRRRLLVLMAAGALAGVRPLRAQGFPQRAVRVVVPYAVGVGPDVVARRVAEALARRWGQPVIVDNRPGASGIVAFAELRRTPPDGHTLFLADTATLAVQPLLQASLPYDPVADLTPLTLLFRATFVLWVGGHSRWDRWSTLQQVAQTAPGSVSYGSLGQGHASHVALETLARAADLQLLHVPFKDAGTLLAAVAAGQVDLTAFSLNSVAGLVAAGRLRGLAVAARRRLGAWPSLPTLQEAGGPDVEMHPWAALVTRSGTPTPVLAALQDALGQVLREPELRAHADQAGFELTPSTVQALHERVAADRASLLPLIAEGRLQRP